jgi:hypothetical protein
VTHHWPDPEHARVLRTVSKIRIVGECWIWEHFNQIRRPNQKQRVRAHRWFYEVFLPVEEEMPEVLVPNCGTENCVKPQHYTAMTWAEFSSGRWRRFRETRKFCKHDHELAKVGTDHRGVCRECLRIQSRRAYLKRKARESQENVTTVTQA